MSKLKWNTEYCFGCLETFDDKNVEPCFPCIQSKKIWEVKIFNGNSINFCPSCHKRLTAFQKGDNRDKEEGKYYQSLEVFPCTVVRRPTDDLILGIYSKNDLIRIRRSVLKRWINELYGLEDKPVKIEKIDDGHTLDGRSSKTNIEIVDKASGNSDLEMVPKTIIIADDPVKTTKAKGLRQDNQGVKAKRRQPIVAPLASMEVALALPEPAKRRKENPEKKAFYRTLNTLKDQMARSAMAFDGVKINPLRTPANYYQQKINLQFSEALKKLHDSSNLDESSAVECMDYMINSCPIEWIPDWMKALYPIMETPNIPEVSSAAYRKYLDNQILY